MNILPILCTAILASILILSGCSGGRSSDYPDRSAETGRKVDEIKRNARDQKEAIDSEYNKASNNLDFRERQIREKYKADKESLAIETDKRASELAAKRMNIEIESKHEKAQIDAELEQQLKSASADDAAKKQADAAIKKAEIDSAATNKLAPILAGIERNEAVARDKRLDLEAMEAKEVSALELERAQHREAMRTKKLMVDRWTTEELAKLDTGTDTTRH